MFYANLFHFHGNLYTHTHARARTHTHTHTQVYMDWANHYLRKAGHSATLSDLKEISDGHFLPQIIGAVGKGERERERERS